MGGYIHTKFMWISWNLWNVTCGILGMCGMLRQRGIAFHTFRLRNDPKRAKIVWYNLNMNTGVEFLEFVECVECCVSTA